MWPNTTKGTSCLLLRKLRFLFQWYQIHKKWRDSFENTSFTKCEFPFIFLIFYTLFYSYLRINLVDKMSLLLYWVTYGEWMFKRGGGYRDNNWSCALKLYIFFDISITKVCQCPFLFYLHSANKWKRWEPTSVSSAKMTSPCLLRCCYILIVAMVTQSP